MNKIKILFRAENIPLIIAFIMSLGFILYDLLQPQFSDAGTTIIIVILGTLSFGLLAERLGYFERIEKTLSLLQDKDNKFLKIPVSWVAFEKYCESAKEIIISGGSLAALVGRYRTLFQSMASNGTEFKFILLNPNNPALSAIAKWADAPPDRFQKEIEVTLAHLKELIDTCGPNIQVRLNNTIPALSVMAFNSREQDGIIHIDLLLYKSSPSRRLYFELTRSPYDIANEQSYQIFLEQLEKQWSEAEPWSG